MTVEVCTVWKKPIANSVGCEDEHIYMQLLKYQKETARCFGHEHVVVTDDTSLTAQYKTMPCFLPAEIMPAMLAGVLYRLGRPVNSHLLFVDVDVLIGRNLEEAFDGSFDLGLTRRNNRKAPINNGAVYVHQDAAKFAHWLFGRALAICGTHWGADQEAISQAAAPVPDVEGVEMRGPYRLAFLPMGMYNAIPKVAGAIHDCRPFVIHFKGKKTKAWAKTYADKFLFGEREKQWA